MQAKGENMIAKSHSKRQNSQWKWKGRNSRSLVDNNGIHNLLTYSRERISSTDEDSPDRGIAFSKVVGLII